MDFLKFKQKLLNKDKVAVIEYTNEDLPYQISYMLKKARMIKGLTQEQLANIIGTKQESIARIENEKSLPSLSFLVKIANAFNAKLVIPVFDFIANDSDLDFYNIRNQEISANLYSPLGEYLSPAQLVKITNNPMSGTGRDDVQSYLI